MPKQKDLKRLVRQRMNKTSESYAAARSRITGSASPPVKDYAPIAGMSDAAVKRKTGRDWAGWVEVLDQHDAHRLAHREIAALLGKRYELPGWWCQTVTVGYERIRGLRDTGQRREGGYDANKSRTFPVPVAALYDAFSQKRRRQLWLDADVTVTTSTRLKSVRMKWLADDTRVHAYFTDKGSGKSQVAIQHVGLASKKAMEAAKKAWDQRLKRLMELLT